MHASLKSRLLIGGAIVAAALAAPAYAQYTGPSEAGRAQNTVEAILANPTDDQLVTLQGQLLRKIGKEKYIFTDGTAEIVTEIDDDDFPREPVDEKTKVEIHGEVDTGLRRPPEIEVDSIRVVK